MWGGESNAALHEIGFDARTDARTDADVAAAERAAESGACPCCL